MNGALDACDAAIAALQSRLVVDLAGLDATFQTKREYERKALAKLVHAQRRRSRSHSRPRARAASLEVLAFAAVRNAEEDAMLRVLQDRFEQATTHLKHSHDALVADTYAWYAHEIETLRKYKEMILLVFNKSSLH
jgi:hypothetical protein